MIRMGLVLLFNLMFNVHCMNWYRALQNHPLSFEMLLRNGFRMLTV